MKSKSQSFGSLGFLAVPWVGVVAVAGLGGIGGALSGCSGSQSSLKPEAQVSEASTPGDAEYRERLARDLKDELEVGRQMAAKLAGTLKLYEGEGASAAQRYVNLVGLTVAQHSSRAEVHYRFGILASDDVNAFAAPGGYIFVTLGLLRELENEHELGVVLAHEVAHVTEKHMYRQIMPNRDVSTGETLTRLLSRGGSDLGMSLTQIVNQGMDLLLEKGLGSEKESDADQVGLVYASASGYDAASLERLLKRLAAKQAHGEPLAHTHPPFPERLASLEKFMKKNGFGTGKARVDSAVMKKRFDQFKAIISNGRNVKNDKTSKS